MSKAVSVMAVQFSLGLVVDGVAGAKTKQAVKDFQAQHGLVADGIIGAKTLVEIDKLIAEKEKKPLDESVFFHHIRIALLKSLNQSQVDGLKAKLAVIADLPVTYQAYILATAYHETAHTMQPIAEYGKGSSRAYGKWVRGEKGDMLGYRNGRKHTYRKADYPHLYYGRGDVQLTWLDNYLYAGKALGIPLAENPDLALNPEISAKIMRVGMMQGWFTTRKLSDFMTRTSADFAKARLIINGVDKKDLIARYAEIFAAALWESKQ